MPPWGDNTAAPTKPKPKYHHHRQRLEAPVTATAIASSTTTTTTPRLIPPSKQRRIAWYTWATWGWMGTLTIIVFFLLLFSGKTAPATAPPPAAVGLSQVQKRNPHHVKVYPFNVYESTAGAVVRYPREGGIPQLDWSAVKHFEACCRDDTSLHCFTASELALRRDPARTARGLPDVYVEIFSAPRWVQVGSRCQLVWSTEKADVES